MTRIDFHTNVSDKISYACRLVRKARKQTPAPSLVLLLEDRLQLGRIDDALWTFSAHDFLPHVSKEHPLASQTPVILTDGDTQNLPHYQILINLSRNTPAQYARFTRVFEIVSQDEQDAQAGRKRYAFYKQNGCTLSHVVAEAA